MSIANTVVVASMTSVLSLVGGKSCSNKDAIRKKNRAKNKQVNCKTWVDEEKGTK